MRVPACSLVEAAGIDPGTTGDEAAHELLSADVAAPRLGWLISELLTRASQQPACGCGLLDRRFEGAPSTTVV